MILGGDLMVGHDKQRFLFCLIGASVLAGLSEILDMTYGHKWLQNIGPRIALT